MLGLMAAIFVATGSLFGPVGAASALALAVLTVFWGFWNTAGKLDAIGAVEVTNPKILKMVASLAAKAGIPAPAVFEIAEKQPNALMLGPTPHQAVLVLTAGLRKRLTDSEFAAVVGHELAHVHFRDGLSASIGVAFLSAITSLALLLGLVGLAARRSGGGFILALAIAAPVIGLVCLMAMGRSAEYRADKFAAELCGDPRDLIAALRKLDAFTRRIVNDTALAQPALASLHIVDPFPGTWLSRLFSTHPRIEKRIARLEKLAN
jgi:heat shock protein HtpX